MKAKLRFALILVVVFSGGFITVEVLIPLLDDAGEAQPASAGQIGWTLDDARSFKGFPLYYLGDNYAGLPLTEIIRYRYEPEPPIPPWEAENIVLFIYGSCTPSGEGRPSCVAPLSLRVEPYCMAPPELFSASARSGEPFDVRDALAEQVAGHLHVWSGEVGITIYTHGLPAQIETAERLKEMGITITDELPPQLEAAEDLRLVNEGPEGAIEPLGPPAAIC